jgi:hypothetical protein
MDEAATKIDSAAFHSSFRLLLFAQSAPALPSLVLKRGGEYRGASGSTLWSPSTLCVRLGQNVQVKMFSTRAHTPSEMPVTAL